jgi:hypothetical protein
MSNPLAKKMVPSLHANYSLMPAPSSHSSHHSMSFNRSSEGAQYDTTLTKQQQLAHHYALTKPHMTAQELRDDEDSTVNIVIAGACFSGKTCLLASFMGDEYIFQNSSSTLSDTVGNAGSQIASGISAHRPGSVSSTHDGEAAPPPSLALDYEPTIGVDFRTYYDMPAKDIRMKLQIWDASGNPAMRSIGELCDIIGDHSNSKTYM